ncbi:DUF2157 domain-containing protein [Caldimonas tepidiphila]|uniref:DUF2157 domain-containing protein n=1 Tax=Caldimonas tepidiphila TaxID=2315841 RepID=UPI000E5B8F14|nr:DUF2157 domain-containing protein [Caldimonas tepidiphila]
MDDTRRETALTQLARHPMDAARRRQWLALAGLAGAPADPQGLLPRAGAALAAGLLGLGLILWVAANWATLGRTGQFALLQGAVVLPAAAAALARARARAALLLVALLAQGGLLACFSQTYQTGADPWQLFALWSLLALPLALAARSELLWTPWALVAITAVALWVGTHTGWRWRADGAALGFTLAGWALCAAIAVALGPLPPLRRRLGTGPWSQRVAALLGLALLVSGSLPALFATRVAPAYPLAVALAAAALLLLWRARRPDVFLLSAVALALDTLLIAGLVRAIFSFRPPEWTGSLLLIGLAAAGLVAATASVVLRAARRPDAAGSAA